MFNTERGRQWNNYFVVQTKVAYANGKNQNVLEVKKFHHRTLKYKSRSDVVKLMKIVTKAQMNLLKDLSTWLSSSIVNYMTKIEQNHAEKSSKPQTHTADNLAIGATSSRRYSSVSNQPQLSLITYTIRVDMSQYVKEMKESKELGLRSSEGLNLFVVDAGLNHQYRQTGKSSSHEKRPSSCIDCQDEKQLVPHDGRGGADRPSSSMAMLESSSRQAGRGPDQTKKHVRFRLYQDPGQGGVQSQQNIDPLHRLPQTRSWIDDSLFASCRDRSASQWVNMIVQEIRLGSDRER